MTTYNLTVDVHDLEPTGPVPPSAEVRIWRAQPDASGPQVVSVKQKTYPAGTGPVVVTLTAGVAYWAEFTGVRGWETPFLFTGTVDTSIAERWRNGQLDPSSLQPLPTVPSIAAAYAALQAQFTAVLSGAPGNLDTFFEAATRFGVDEATVTTLQALVAGKADAASVAATYVTYDGTNLRKAGNVIPITGGGGGGSTSIVDNGDGTLSSTSSLIVDNGDGTLSAA